MPSVTVLANSILGEGSGKMNRKDLTWKTEQQMLPRYLRQCPVCRGSGLGSGSIRAKSQSNCDECDGTGMELTGWKLIAVLGAEDIKSRLKEPSLVRQIFNLRAVRRTK